MDHSAPATALGWMLLDGPMLWICSWVPRSTSCMAAEGDMRHPASAWQVNFRHWAAIDCAPAQSGGMENMENVENMENHMETEVQKKEKMEKMDYMEMCKTPNHPPPPPCPTCHGVWLPPPQNGGQVQVWGVRRFAEDE